MDKTKTSKRATIRGSIVFLACCLFIAGNAGATGTPAGTIITSSVSMTYEKSGVPQPPLAGTASFAVDRVINMLVTKNADATIAPGSINEALLFLVSNTGNTAARFALGAVSKATNTWTMDAVRVYRDNNNSGGWDVGDTPYIDAGTFGDVVSDASITVLVVANTPAGVSPGQAAKYDLTAAAVDAGTLNLSVQTNGPGTAGIDTVFAESAGSAVGDGSRDGKHSADGTYTAGKAVVPVVTMTKTVAILDQWGGSLPIPGATLRYTITATANGTANNVVVSDPLPTNTSFIPNTLKLNNSALTDAADADAGDVGGTTADTITVNLGNLTNTSAMQTITFEVKIK